MTGDRAAEHIAIVGPYPPLRGGIAHFTTSLHDEIRRRGARVTGISFSRQYPDVLFPGRSQVQSDADPADYESDVVIDTIRPSTWTRAAQSILDSGAEEVVFMYWMPFFAPAYARMARILRDEGVPVAAIVHNATPHERVPFGTWLARRFFRRCDRLVALSQTVASDLSALPAQAPVEVIPHPVYARFGEGIPREQAREHLGLASRLDLILFFGLVRPYKGLDVLLDAFGRLAARRPELHLMVAGEFYEGRRAAEQRIEHHGIRDQVTLLDRYIPDGDVKLYFSAADVVVQPYRSATQSGVVQTAFQFDRPVIVTDVGELARMVEPGVDGLVVPPEDPGELSEAIARFFDTDLGNRLKQGVTSVKTRMTWSKFVIQLLGPAQRP